jgi:hypothetical protein
LKPGDGFTILLLTLKKISVVDERGLEPACRQAGLHACLTTSKLIVYFRYDLSTEACFEIYLK